MEIEKKIDSCKYAIGRFDGYYNGVNTKGAFYLTVNTFIIASAATAYGFFKTNNIVISDMQKWFLIIITVMAFSAIVLILFAVNPFLNSGNSDKYKSLLFFRSIAEMKERDFCDEMDQLTMDKCFNDYKNQTYQLAVGLTKKFNYLTWAARLLLAEFLIISILIISLITK